MKKTLIALILTGIFASVTYAASESYTINKSAGVVKSLDRLRLFYNGSVCAAYSLALTCTQAQVCVAAEVPGGASCTGADAKAAGVFIYSDTLNDRGKLLDSLSDDYINRLYTKIIPASDSDAYRTWFKAQNQATQDAECAKIGQPTGCTPWR